MKGFYSITLLIISNLFMTFAWYGHLYLFKKMAWFAKMGLFGVVMVSWGLALFECMFQVPANRIEFEENGVRPFSTQSDSAGHHAHGIFCLRGIRVQNR